MTDTLTDLIERVERASEGSRELDWLIAEVLGEIPDHTIREVGWDYNWYRRADEHSLTRVTGGDQYAGCESWAPRRRTQSIDEAMTLIMPGKDACGVLWDVEAWGGPGVHAPHVAATAWVCGAPRVYAATPALALCAASLKARMGTGG